MPNIGPLEVAIVMVMLLCGVGLAVAIILLTRR
jgi:hypothetical protein